MSDPVSSEAKKPKPPGGPKRTRVRKPRAAKATPAPDVPTPPPVAPLSLKQVFPPELKEQWKADAEKRQRDNIASARDMYIRRGLVVYLGAGVSCSVGLPTWWELIRSLTVTMMSERVDGSLEKLQDLTKEERVQVKAQIQDEVAQGAGADKSLLILARAIKEFFKDRLPKEVAQAVYRPLIQSTGGILDAIARFFAGKKIQEGSLERYPKIKESRLFQALVQLLRAQRDVRGVQAIVNFNYDDLIEEWARENGIRCDTILSGHVRSHDASLPSYHVHGVLPFRRVQDLDPKESIKEIIGNFVFSEDEYHTEYSDPYRWSNMTMINQLGRFSGLFVGLSLQDPNHRRIIDVTHRQYPDIPNYAILTRKAPPSAPGDAGQSTLSDLFEKVETESFEQIGVNVIWTDTYDEVPNRIFDICKIDQ